jgi:hypothetical protein
MRAQAERNFAAREAGWRIILTRTAQEGDLFPPRGTTGWLQGKFPNDRGEFFGSEYQARARTFNG